VQAHSLAEAERRRRTNPSSISGWRSVIRWLAVSYGQKTSC